MAAANLRSSVWVALGAISQIVATALLLRVMSERNFTLGVAYSKSEILQVALFGFVFLGDRFPPGRDCDPAGHFRRLLLSPADKERPIRRSLTGWTRRSAMLGIASGTVRAAAVGFRGAALALGGAAFPMAAAARLLSPNACKP